MTALALARDAERIDAAALQARLGTRPGARESADFASSLNVLTCGSVDDGKSTLIGRLLWDTGLHADQRARLERLPKTAAGTPDFSLLVDGLGAEREQGITIDIAWRYLDTPARRLVVIDSPGHEQYTRNMATGASHADVAILLVDARSGVKEQTRRHAAILDLMGVRRVVLAVNKMDLVGWSEARFAEIEAEFEPIAERFGFEDALAIPVSAVLGDNIARRSSAMLWYAGPSLLDHLGGLPSRSHAPRGDLRFPVQFVVRAGQDFRGLAGTITTGSIATNEEILEPITGRRAKVKRIVTMGKDLERAGPGQAVVLELDTHLDVSRGAILARSGAEPIVTRSIEARIVWLADAPFTAKHGYFLRTSTDLVPIAAVDIRTRLDLATLEERPQRSCAANEIVLAGIELARLAAVDLFADQPDTGSFVLIDAVSGTTVAGGVVAAASRRQQETRRGDTFRLTRDLLERGIGADLPPGAGSDPELRRRANEVAALLREAGVAVEIEDAWGSAGIDLAAFWTWMMLIFSFAFIGAVLLGLV